MQKRTDCCRVTSEACATGSFRRACFHDFAHNFLCSGFLFRANNQAPMTRFGEFARTNADFPQASRQDIGEIFSVTIPNFGNRIILVPIVR